MAQQTINIGSGVNKGDGDALRTAFDKVNDNFDELYASNIAAQTLTLVGNALTISDGNSVDITGLTQDFAFSSLTGTPTTLAGYGITDALQTGAAFDVQGSVFADDSTLLVDAVNGEIPGYVKIRPVLTDNSNNWSTLTDVDPDTYSGLNLTNIPSSQPLVNLLDGNYNGQTFFLVQNYNGGYNISIRLKTWDSSTQAVVIQNSLSGEFVWQGSHWIRLEDRA